MQSEDTVTTPSRGGATLGLAVVGNCAISALIDHMARIVWYCSPRFDSTPVFQSLLCGAPDAAREGFMGVELEGLVRTEQSYDAGTAILRTRLIGDKGDVVEVTDFAPRFLHHDRMFRPAQLVRRVRPLQGHPRVRFIVRPKGEWGAAEPVITRGSHHLRYVLPEQTVRLNTSVPPTYVVDERWFLLTAPVSLLLGPDETLVGSIEDTAREFEEHTVFYWRGWTRRLALPYEWQDVVIRSAITLKLCQFEETGAIVAAMTTSIPEAADSGRNWDYRYCWLRDAFFVVRALNSLSEVGTMESYLQWLQNIVSSSDDGHVQPLYGIGLEHHLVEQEIQAISGYRGMGPVRVGNQAFEHFQHDVYGNIVLGAAQSFHDQRLFRPAMSRAFAQLERAGEQAWRLHDQPDAGMWELRTRSRVHTSSSLMCWAACDRLGKIARVLGLAPRAAHWVERAQHIRDKILQQAWSDKRQAFVESFGGSSLDASVLLMCEVGFIDARDPRFVSTLKALELALCDGPFMRRYEAADDFGRPETAFNVCSFWRIDALSRMGREQEARDIFGQLLACRNPVGLLSEDTLPATGEAWGNFPQTYSMVGLINGAVRLSEPWESFV
jgi:GH15 family glucan-1,4-alpha-glucosidase